MVPNINKEIESWSSVTKRSVLFLDFSNRLTIEDLATRDTNVINVPVALPTGYVVNRPNQVIGDRVDVNKDGPSKEVSILYTFIMEARKPCYNWGLVYHAAGVKQSQDLNFTK